MVRGLIDIGVVWLKEDRTPTRQTGRNPHNDRENWVAYQCCCTAQLVLALTSLATMHVVSVVLRRTAPRRVTCTHALLIRYAGCMPISVTRIIISKWIPIWRQHEDNMYTEICNSYMLRRPKFYAVDVFFNYFYKTVLCFGINLFVIYPDAQMN